MILKASVFVKLLSWLPKKIKYLSLKKNILYAILTHFLKIINLLIQWWNLDQEGH